MNNIENEKEVKILGIDVSKLEYALYDNKAQFAGLESQDNVFVGKQSGPNNGDYLRIRTVSRNGKIIRNTLTYKESVSSTDKSKNSKEYSVEVSSVSSTLRILDKMGYDSIYMANKVRKIYKFLGAELHIDMWSHKFFPEPYLEIKAQSDDIIQLVIDILGLSNCKLYTKSILELRKDYKGN